MRLTHLVLVSAIVLLLASEVAWASVKCTVPSQRVQCGEYTCIPAGPNKNKCGKCISDGECWDPAMMCNSEGKCKLKSLAETFKNRPGGVLGAVLIGLGVCSIAVIAGVGGGGILVPMYMILLGVPSIAAVALSQATITGQSLFNVILQVRRYHPDYQPPKPTRPVINWPLLAFWLPISLIGTMYGNLAGKVVPDWFRLSLLFILLSYVLYRTILRMKMQRAADKAKLLEKQQKEAEEAERASRDEGNVNASERPVITGEGEKLHDPNAPPAAPRFPPVPLAIAFMTFVPLFVANFLKAHVAKCGEGFFWAIVAVMTLYCLAISLGYRERLRRFHMKILLDEEDPERVPFKWNRKTTILFPVISVFAGGAASLLGIGGGLILSFLLLEAGLVPEEQSATSGMTTFLVAFESLLQFVIQKAIRWDYGILFLCVGLCSTALGQVYVYHIRKRGLRFLIIMALAFIMIGSMVALSAVGIRDTVVLLQHGGSIGFGDLCLGKIGNLTAVAPTTPIPGTLAPPPTTALPTGTMAPGASSVPFLPPINIIN